MPNMLLKIPKGTFSTEAKASLVKGLNVYSLSGLVLWVMTHRRRTLGSPS